MSYDLKGVVVNVHLIAYVVNSITMLPVHKSPPLERCRYKKSVPLEDSNKGLLYEPNQFMFNRTE